MLVLPRSAAEHVANTAQVYLDSGITSMRNYGIDGQGVEHWTTRARRLAYRMEIRLGTSKIPTLTVG